MPNRRYSPIWVLRATFILVARRDVTSGPADIFGPGRTNSPKWPPVMTSRSHATRDAVGTYRNLAIGNDFHYQVVVAVMSHSTLRPVIKLRSTAGTGYTYVTRKSRRNDPDRLVIRKYDPVTGRHVEFREER